MNDFDKTTAIKCEKCGCDYFESVFILRKVSKLLIGSNEDGVIPINVFSCKKCGHINDELMPLPLKEEDKEEQHKTGLIL